MSYDEYKQKTLFDHINQIKTEKNINYYNNLNEIDKKNFNQYLILTGLSMNENYIDEISYILKYVNTIPNIQFYKMCCDIIPYDKTFSKWIKSKKIKFNFELINYISKYYEIGIDDATEYCQIMYNKNIDELKLILQKFGLDDKKIKQLLVI